MAVQSGIQLIENVYHRDREANVAATSGQNCDQNGDRTTRLNTRQAYAVPQRELARGGVDFVESPAFAADIRAVWRASTREHAVRHLQADIEKIRQDNRSTAQLACAYMDLVQRTGLKPADLLDMQTGLRRDLLWVEDRLRTTRARAKELRRRLVARMKSGRASRDAVLEHMAALRTRDKVLVLRRMILRQVADAFAWVVLRQDARLILPLYREQTHQLPRGEGLSGPAELGRRAMGSGEFFVVENDLTRCLGVGDLTVVFASRPLAAPADL